MKKIFLLLLLVTSSYAFTQGEAANWFFGNGAGLTFDISTGIATPTNAALGTINTNEGCSSISDVNGNLLFYTDGRNVWDKNFQIMPNADYFGGTGLLGDPSSTSSGLIVPKPGNLNQYYIFTVDEPHHDNAAVYPSQFTGNYSDSNGTIPLADDGFNNGFNYSLVDLTLNGGFGDIEPTEKNIHLITYDATSTEQSSYKCSEKITAVAHADGNSYWVITHFIDTFYTFRVDASGVNLNPVTTTINPVITTNGYRRNAIGYIKSSPDGSKIAVCHAENGNVAGVFAQNSGSLMLYDFDNNTGIVSNATSILENIQLYGTEFSADSKKLYASNVESGQSKVSQFDLDNNNAQTDLISQSGNPSFISAIQLAPNGKIYVCNLINTNALDVIENPEEAGLACNYNISGQLLENGTSARLGLPPFIQSFLIAKIEAENLCFGDITQFTVDSSETILNILWDFGDLTTSTLESPTHIYTISGNYTVTVTVTTADETQIFTRGITISEIPQVFQPQNILVCDDNNDNQSSFDFTTKDSEVLNTQDNTVFTVHYFISQINADNFENEIEGSFQNSENPQQIFARIHNTGNNLCYETTSFSIEVFNTPTANLVDDVIECDDAIDGDDTNGQKEFNLLEINTIILDNQNDVLYTITYHNSQIDANSGDNTLSLTYYNQIPFNETIFARIENNLNTDCFNTTAIKLIVNPVPESFNTALLQCDEDGIPEGFTTFNLTQATNDLIGGVANRSVKFFTTLVDAQNTENEIDGNAFNNWFNPQIIYTQIIDDTTGCFSIAELTLEVSTTNISDFQPTPLCDELESEDGINSFNLSSVTTEIQDFNNIAFPVTFYENYIDALLEQDPLSASYTNTTPYNQIIYARVENNNNCYGIAEIQLTVFKLPQLEEDENLLYCLNEFPDSILTLSGGVINDDPSNYYYQWFFNNSMLNENEADITINEIGTYKVIVTTTEGCDKERIFTVEPSNIATFETIEITDASQNNTITIIVSGEGDYLYALDDENGIYQESNVFENVIAGFHTVYVKDVKNNCGIVDTLVSVIGFPKFFTPNGDSYNPTWHVHGVSEQFQPNTKIQIFNRFGKLVSVLSPLGPGWDGTFNGENMPADDYWFFVTLQDGRVFKNHFSLKR